MNINKYPLPKKGMKNFKFVDDIESTAIDLAIQETADTAYGLYVWPCAPVLAQYVWERRHTIRGKRVLELGAGTALPGILAAKCGADVILSDCVAFTDCQELCRKNAQLNNVPHISVIGLTWGQITPVLTHLPNIHLVLASDCFYDSKDFEDVVMTMSYILQRNPEAEVLCSYQERSSERSIEHLLNKWNLSAVEVPLPDDYPESNQNQSFQEIHIFIFTLKE